MIGGHRGARRQSTLRHARRAQAIHVHLAHPDGDVDCVCERSVWWFARRGVFGCGCRRRQQGNPKYARGCCAHGMRPAVVERIEGKRECRRWR